MAGLPGVVHHFSPLLGHRASPKCETVVITNERVESKCRTAAQRNCARADTFP